MEYDGSYRTPPSHGSAVPARMSFTGTCRICRDERPSRRLLHMRFRVHLMPPDGLPAPGDWQPNVRQVRLLRLRRRCRAVGPGSVVAHDRRSSEVRPSRSRPTSGSGGHRRSNFSHWRLSRFRPTGCTWRTSSVRKPAHPSVQTRSMTKQHAPLGSDRKELWPPVLNAPVRDTGIRREASRPSDIAASVFRLCLANAGTQRAVRSDPARTERRRWTGRPLTVPSQTALVSFNAADSDH